MKTIARIAFASLVCILGLGGCKKHEAVLPPDAKVNPNPTKKYRLLLTVPDPPGELSVTGELTYAIENSRGCVPLDHTLAIWGVHSSFPRTMQAQVVPLDGGEIPARGIGNSSHGMTLRTRLVKEERASDSLE